MATKVCSMCKESKLLTSEFWSKDKSTKNGFNCHCKLCRKKINANWLKKNPDYNKSRANYQTEYLKKWKQRNWEKYQAHVRVGYEVRTGRIPRASAQNCADCGKQAKDYHHQDYSKPLNVIPLCRPCHKKRHNKSSLYPGT